MVWKVAIPYKFINGGFVGLVAMTPASHAGGRQFDPAKK